MSLGPPELLIVFMIVLVLFGSSKLPKLARSIGEAQQEFKRGSAEGAIQAGTDEVATGTTPPP